MSTDCMTTGFSSPRPESFPAGLRVLVVDDDPTWLKILEKMLKKCSYEVTTCGLAIEALDLLRERKDSFDIVISDVNMPDMDGFKLLEHVGLEMDLPVIMMSVDGETSRVMRGVQHGACDYLLKPIRMKELRNIWQHVYRKKKIHEVRNIENLDGFEEIQLMSNRLSDFSDDGYFLYGGDMGSGKKRKDSDQNKYDDQSKDFSADLSSSAAAKRARVVWTVDLHQKFVKAVNQIGFDKVGPKKILDLMNVQWLTRENVASHLQKYRLYLSRLQKENDPKACSGGMMKGLDHSPRDPPVGPPNSIGHQQNDAANSNYGIPSSILVQNAGDLKSIRPNKVLTGYISDANKASSSSRHSFGYMNYDSTFPMQYSGCKGASELHFHQEHKPNLQVNNGLNHLQNQNQVNLQSIVPSFHHRPLNKVRDKPENLETTLSHVIKHGGNKFDSFPEPSQPNVSSTWSLENQGFEHFSLNNLGLVQGNMILGKMSAFASSKEDLQTGLLQSQCSSTNDAVQNRGVGECNEPEVIPEVSPYLYDALRFDYEYPSETIDYPVIGQGLYII